MILDYLKVVSNEQISAGVFKTVFEHGLDMPDIIPGQFMNIYPKNPMLTLPRPISICDVQNGRLVVVFKAVGEGTKEFSAYLPGDRVRIMCPLGNGFDTPVSVRNAVIAGGGIGTPPLLLLAKTLKQNGARVTVFLGFDDKPILTEHFKSYADNLFVATETGSCGEKGNVLELMRKYDSAADMYYACGPAPMLKAISCYLRENGREGRLSLEQRMACGFGACVGCAVKIVAENGWKYSKACKDGPVFDYKEVLWD